MLLPSSDALGSKKAMPEFVTFVASEVPFVFGDPNDQASDVFPSHRVNPSGALGEETHIEAPGARHAPAWAVRAQKERRT